MNFDVFTAYSIGWAGSQYFNDKVVPAHVFLDHSVGEVKGVNEA